MIRNVTIEDAESVKNIFNFYVENTIVTFEEIPITLEEMSARIKETIELKIPMQVYEVDGEIVGYAYASKWKSRCAYRESLETTVYLKPDFKGKGAGSKLYTALITKIRHQNYHSIIGGIALPNDASVALHEKFGFEKVGHFKEVGKKFNKYIDVGYWQMIL